MKDSFSQTFLPIPFGALFSSRSHSFFWRGFDKLFLSVSCFFFFFFFFDRLGNQDREIHVFVSLNYDGSGVYI